MPSQVEERLVSAGLELPPPLPTPRSKLVRYLVDGDHIYLSGAGPFRGAELVWKGKLGADLSLEEGRQAAALTALNMVRILGDAGFDLDRLRWIKVLGMVNSHPDFHDQAAVVNGFSELILELFGEERGLPARSAMGAAVMPWNMAIEVEGVCRLL